MNTPQIVSPQEWTAAREALLVKEKELIRAGDALAAERRRMPWMAVEKDYRFEGPDGPASLLDLFEGRRQLIVYRAFYGAEVTTTREGGAYPERACVGCSMVADHVAQPRSPARARHDARLRLARAAGRDPRPARSAWDGSTSPGTRSRTTSTRTTTSASGTGTTPSSATASKIFRTYLINGRGDEGLGTNWSYLDITALGRQEAWEDSPDGYPQTPPYEWWNYHDAYGEPMIAHVAGVPLEELLPLALTSGGSAAAARGTRVGCSTEAQRVGVAPHTLALARPGR